MGLPALYCHVNSEKVVCLIDLEEAIFWYCDKNKLSVDPENVPPLKAALLHPMSPIRPIV